MAAPTLVQAGTGQVVTTSTPVACSLAGVTVGNFIMLHVFVDANDLDVQTTSISGVENLAGTANSLTNPSVSGSAPGNERQAIWVGRATATSVSVSVATITGSDCYFRLYEFSGVASGTTVASVLENDEDAATPDVYTEGSGSTAAINDVSVTTMGADRLALNLIGVNDDNQASFDTEAFTGQSGGTWVSGGSYGSSTGTDGAIGLQHATMAAAGTINGGSLTMAAADGWNVIGTALKPAASTPASLPHLPFTQTSSLYQR